MLQRKSERNISMSQEVEGTHAEPGYSPSYWQQIYELDRTVATKTILGWLRSAPGERVLDVGCGAGRFLVEFEKNGSSTVGIEPDIRPLGIAKPRVKGSLIQSSAVCLPFSDSTFDKVLCNHVIEHVENPDQAFGEIRRVLRTGGTFVLSFPNSNYLPYRLGVVKQDKTHHWEFSHSLVVPGFEILEKRVFPSLPLIGDGLLEVLRLSRVPGLRNVFYNVVLLLRKT